MKGLGKKRKEIVEAFESQFKDGALSKNIDLDAIDSIWHQMETLQIWVKENKCDIGNSAQLGPYERKLSLENRVNSVNPEMNTEPR